MKKPQSLRYMMVVPMLLLLASVLTEFCNCRSARIALKEDLNQAITILATTEDDFVARQDTIQRLEQINYAMAQPLYFVADQKLPGTFFTLSVASMASLAFYMRRKEQLAPMANVALADIRLTPMQRQLVDMLLAAPDGCVSKYDICSALWGKKDNAEESLYTLIRRTKKSLAETNAEIICNRGESYQLKINS